MIEKLLKVATNEIGVKEDPIGSNKVKYNNEQGFAPGAWCCAFVRWCFKESGIIKLWESDIERESKKTAYCPYVAASAKTAGKWVTGGYKRGDIVLYDFNNNNQADHIGIIESFNGKALITIEGNVGDSVKRCTRILDKTILGAYRTNYVNEVKDSIAELVRLGRINTPEYWYKLMNCEVDPVKENLQALFDKWLVDAQKVE